MADIVDKSLELSRSQSNRLVLQMTLLDIGHIPLINYTQVTVTSFLKPYSLPIRAYKGT
jgi:hypothetical protein